MRNSSFPATPDYARLRFSRGPSAPEVQWGLCTLFDPDRSLLGDSKFLDPGLGPYFLRAAARHEWPPEVLRDCQAWAKLGYPDDYDGSGTCLWWLRKYDSLRPAISDAGLRGLVARGLAGSSYADAFCEEIFTLDGGAVDNGVSLCSGMEPVLLKTIVPLKKVSGSEVLYGPVGYVNMRSAFYGSSLFAGADTSVDIYRDYTDPRAEQMPPQTGKEPETFVPRDPRYTQPYLASLVNHGFYRIEYTGDITLFNDGFLEYSLVSLTDAPAVHGDFALVVDVKFLKAVNLAFYHDGRQVAASPRRDKVSLAAPAGTNYLDPVSKVLSFVVKGTVAPVRIRQLDVVSVAFGVATTFEAFFEDNFVDPNAIDAAFADKVRGRDNAG